MATEDSPKDTSQWVKFLVNEKPPVRLSVISRLQKKLQDKNCSVMQLSRIIKADPVLCLHIVSLAGDLHDKKDSEVTSIDHAISSIGVQKLDKLIQKVPTIRLNANSVAHKMYFRSVANSYHAAIQARTWLVKTRSGMFAEESFLAALFYGVGHWMLWSFAPIHMSRIEVLIREKGALPEIAEQQVLGCTIASISKGLIDRWFISPLALETLHQDSPLNKQIITKLHQRALGDPRLHGDELRSLNHLIQQKSFPVKLANMLSSAANYSWSSDSAMDIIDIINDYLRGELGKTVNFLHQNCADAARQYHVVGTLSPAAEMLMLNSEISPNYRLTGADKKLIPDHTPRPAPVKKESAPTTQTNAKTTQPTDSDFADEAKFTEIAARLLKPGDKYSQAAEILNDLILGLTEGLGLSRIAINIIPGKAELIKVVLDKGFEPGHPISKSSHKLSENSLFSRLWEKPACMRVNNQNRQRIRSMLPDSFNPLVSEQDFLLMSLFAGNKPVAVVYADRDGSKGGTTDFHQEKLKYLCSAAGVSLKHVTQKRSGAK